MCLLAIAFHARAELPLVVAANRDEWLARPAVPMTVLEDGSPRTPSVVGGRDLVAGGTWLAVGAHGVVAGLTNVPSLRGRDPSRRSRGELPLGLARHASAEAAVAALTATRRCEDYNPCRLLVADRVSLYYVEVEGAGAPRVERLQPGLHVLENQPLAPRSPKAEAARRALTSLSAVPVDELPARLQALLADHRVAEGALPEALPTAPPSFPPSVGNAPENNTTRSRKEPGFVRPPALEALCVHAGAYGTRSSEIVLVGATPAPPAVYYTDGPPCTSELLRARW